MAECARVAEVNAFIRLGGRPVLWKGTVFRVQTRDGVIVPSFVVIVVGRGTYFARRTNDRRGRSADMYQFDAGDYSGRTIVVDVVPPEAPPVGEWGEVRHRALRDGGYRLW